MAQSSTLSLMLAVLLLGLLVNQGVCRPGSEEPPASSDYINDEYDDNDGEDEEQFTGPPPMMLSQPKMIEAREGETVALPCEVTNQEQVLKVFAVIWKNESLNLYTDGSKSGGVDPRIVYHRENNSLVIRNVKKADMGRYNCLISSTPPVEVTHVLNVFAPAKVTSIEPKGPNHTLKKGSSLTLRCNVTGYPVPSVKWAKKGKHDNVEAVIVTTEPNITFNSVDRRDSGIYECIAENNQGPKSSASVSVRVTYAPEINVDEEIVATGEDYDAELKCVVHAEPKPTVHWLRDNTVIEASDRYEFKQQSHVHSLQIKKVKKDDFGKYTCRASNNLGSDVSKVIELTGKPNTPRFVSANIGADGRSLDIEYHIVSYAPLLEYKLLYKQVGDKVDQTWQSVKPPVEDGLGGNIFKLMYKLEQLPVGDFMVSLRARNDYGWSSQAKAHSFTIKEENHEATAETSKMEESAEIAPSDSTRPRLMAILTIISLSSFFL